MARFRREMKFCRTCCRNDWHKPVRFGLLWSCLAIVGTLGLAWLARPYRCSCCGTVRPRRLPRVWRAQRAES